MNPKKWVKTVSNILFVCGVFTAFVTAGNCDAYPYCSVSKVAVKAAISLLLIIQNFILCKEQYE